jgi:hypothetical protein
MVPEFFMLIFFIFPDAETGSREIYSNDMTKRSMVRPQFHTIIISLQTYKLGPYTIGTLIPKVGGP